jgi:hypothetical protein
VAFTVAEVVVTLVAEVVVAIGAPGAGINFTSPIQKSLNAAKSSSVSNVMLVMSFGDSEKELKVVVLFVVTVTVDELDEPVEEIIVSLTEAVWE